MAKNRQPLRPILFPDIHKASGRHRIYPQQPLKVVSLVHEARFAFARLEPSSFLKSRPKKNHYDKFIVIRRVRP